MASTINATSSGSGGLISTGDASGQLELQTNGTTRVTVDTSGNATFAGNLAVNGTLTASSGLPSLASPLTVTGNSTAGAELRLPEDTDNGSNYVAIKSPDSLSANVTLTAPSAQTSATLGYLNIPRSGSAKTTSYQLATTDVGQLIEIGSGGSITIPDATFSTGDVVMLFNNTSGSITITCSITTAYIGGTDSDKATVTLLTRGVCNILFVSGTVCVITGNVS